MYSAGYDKITKWYLWIPIISRLMGYHTKLDDFKSGSMGLAADIVKRRKAKLKINNATEKDLQDEQGVVNGFGVVDRFILSKDLTEQELLHETFTLFTASQEATGKVASCLLLLLAHLPKWQDKVYNKLLEVVSEDRHLTEEDLRQLVILDAVFKEALRYMPIAANIQRTVTEDITLEKLSVTIPAGTAVVIPIHAMHRDPKYWDEPDLVKPERFLSENVNKIEPAAFLPFSYGAMECIGRQNASSIVKVLVARVVRNYRLSADGRIEDLELDVAVSAKFKHGYYLRVQRRTPPAYI